MLRGLYQIYPKNNDELLSFQRFRSWIFERFHACAIECKLKTSLIISGNNKVLGNERQHDRLRTKFCLLIVSDLFGSDIYIYI